jgi:hypothetical protein
MSRSRKFLAAAILLIVSSLLAVGLGELFFRGILYSESLPGFGLRQPWHYADANLDDDFWKLAFLFGTTRQAQAVGYVDPELGWAPKSSPENPLGIYAVARYRLEDIRRPILFYGDSFVAGPENIPGALDLLLPDRFVLNYGVGGYGLDQIYLRFNRTIGKFESPIVLVGILTDDLDRSILGFRTHQKPYFDVHDGKLILRNTPILPTTREYIEQNPPEIKSYFLRFVFFQFRPYLPEHWFDRVLGYGEKRLKKRAVNRRILQGFKEDANALGVPLYVVIFYSGEELEEPTWREPFLKEILQDLAISYFDTKPYLLSYMARTGATLGDLYHEDKGHLNHDGRKVITQGLYEWLKITL